MAIPEAGREPAIEGLRAVAAGFVLVFHLIGAIAIVRPDRISRRFEFWTDQFGHFGVALFFVVSGFVLYRPWLRAELGVAPRPQLGRYFVRRFARIYPAYWVAAIVYLAWLLTPEPIGVSAWVEYLALVQNYRNGHFTAGLGVAWTLVIEVSFYLCVPVVAWCARSVTPSPRSVVVRQGIAIGTLLAVGHATRFIALHLEPVPSGSWQFWRFPWVTLLGFVDWFAFGMGLALIAAVNERAGANRAAAFLRRHGSGLLAAGVVMYCGAHLADFPTGRGVAMNDAQRLIRGGVIPFAAALVAAPVLLAAPMWLTRVLARPVAVWLGTISYGLYLWQIPAIRLVRNLIEDGHLPARPELLVVASTTFTVGAATASWYLLERPTMQVIGRLRPG